MASIRLDELAERLDARLEGDGALTVDRPDTLADAVPGTLSFLANPRYAGQLADTRATAVFVPADFAGDAPCALLRVANPDLAFARATRLLVPPPPPPPPAGVHPTALVAADAVLGAGVSVGPYAIVEAGARIGDGTTLAAHVCVGPGAVVGRDCALHPRVTLYYGVRLGDRVIVQSGAVIGADGFGYLWNGAALEKTPQVGTVDIADDVEIGANACIDRARFGATRVGNGSKIDNLVDIAHNVRIGRHCAFASQTGIAGTASVGDGVIMGGQVGVAGHIRVGDRSMIAGQAGITRDVPPGATMMGFPARTQKAFVEERHQIMAIARLRRTVRAIVGKLGIQEE